ncbi:MAG: DMT family transporter [Pseudomonadota bacterium]
MRALAHLTAWAYGRDMPETRATSATPSTRSPAGDQPSVAQTPAQNPALAIALMFVAGALVAIISILAKILGTGEGGLHPLQVSAGRFGFAFLTLMALITLRPALRPSLRTAHLGTHIARVVFGWGGVTLMFAAVARMPVAEATAISFLSPVFTVLLAVVFLSESLTARKTLAAIVALVGAGLLLRPGGEAFQIAGLLALASAGFLAIEVLFIKRLTNTEPPLRILVINNGVGSLIALSAAAFFWQMPSAAQWPAWIAVGVIMVTAQGFFLQSMRRAEASLVSPAFYSVLVFAALYDFALFDVVPDALALIGMGLILAAALSLAATGRK